MKHGLYASDVVLPGKNEQEFKELHQSIRAELEPDGASEEEEVFDVAQSRFMMRRIRRLFQVASRGNADVVRSLVPSSSAAAAAAQQTRQESFNRASNELQALPFDMILESLQRPQPDLGAIYRLTAHTKQIVETTIAPAVEDLKPAEPAAEAADLLKANAELVRLLSEVEKRIEKTMARFYNEKAHKDLQRAKKEAKVRQIKSSPSIANKAPVPED